MDMARKLRRKLEDKIYKDHRIAQVWGVEDVLVLDSEEKLREVFNSICRELELKVVNRFVHKFSPEGISLIYVLSQSHLAVHTWPEAGYLHVDVFTCSKSPRLNFLKRIIRKYIKGTRYKAGKVQY